MEDTSLQNTNISFTPSFLGQDWDTSLSPRFDARQARFERGHIPQYEFKITFNWLRKMFLKMLSFRPRKEGILSWTAIARLFL